jgi:hypothetical protein
MVSDLNDLDAAFAGIDGSDLIKTHSDSFEGAFFHETMATRSSPSSCRIVSSACGD